MSPNESIVVFGIFIAFFLLVYQQQHNNLVMVYLFYGKRWYLDNSLRERLLRNLLAQTPLPSFRNPKGIQLKQK